MRNTFKRKLMRMERREVKNEQETINDSKQLGTKQKAEIV